MLLIKLPTTFTDATLPNPTYADPMLAGAGSGVRTLFDLAAATSWAKQAAPADGDPVVDLAASGAGNLTAKVTGTAPTYSGGGFDFTPTTNSPTEVRAPSGALSTIWSAANQYFMVCGYFKLPAKTDWMNAAGIVPFMTATATAGGYATPEVDLLTVAQGNSSTISARRQTDGGTTLSNLSVTVPDAAFGTVAQIAYSRNATGERLALYTTASGLTVATQAAGANNTGNFSAQSMRWGITSAFFVNSSTARRNAERLYRGFIEDLSLSGRDPATVLAADWAAVTSRFS